MAEGSYPSVLPQGHFEEVRDTGAFRDLTGQKFERLTAISKVEGRRKKGTYWLCRCDCGNYVEVYSGNLTNGRQKSCGCYSKDHPSRRTHGMRKTRLYNTWSKMKDRCNNPNSNRYEYYGGRGIKLCDEWQRFEPFYKWAMENGYSDSLTIDRIDVNGDYTPTNCRWTDIVTQMNNMTTNVRFMYNGKNMTISEIARETGFPKDLLYSRLEKGYSLEESLKYQAGELPWDPPNSRYITWNEKTLNMDQWARELGMRPGALRYRLNEAKWSIEKAFTTPVKACAKGA